MEAFYLGNIYVTYLSQGMCKYLILRTFRRAHNPKSEVQILLPLQRTRPSVYNEKLRVFVIYRAIFKATFHCILAQFWLVETILFSHVLVIVWFS